MKNEKIKEIDEAICEFCNGERIIEEIEGYRDMDTMIYMVEGTGRMVACFNCNPPYEEDREED